MAQELGDSDEFDVVNIESESDSEPGQAEEVLLHEGRVFIVSTARASGGHRPSCTFEGLVWEVCNPATGAAGLHAPPAAQRQPSYHAAQPWLYTHGVEPLLTSALLVRSAQALTCSRCFKAPMMHLHCHCPCAMNHPAQSSPSDTRSLCPTGALGSCTFK